MIHFSLSLSSSARGLQREYRFTLWMMLARFSIARARHTKLLLCGLYSILRMNALARKHVNAPMCAASCECPRADSSVFPVYAGTTQDYHLGSILITRLPRRAQKKREVDPQ